jgi:dTDP-4-amino-4,6-dideoxygalactose transaminase
MNLLPSLFNQLKLSGDGPVTKKVTEMLSSVCGGALVKLTTSCTHALEMAALLLDVEEGDEIIMPSYTFVSTANAFVLRGAKIIFVDIDPATMNISVESVANAINSRTKAIVPVHYAGVACDMGSLLDLGMTNQVAIVEDAAQGVRAFYLESPLGTIGQIGAFSFHDTKNYTMGEGGALLINDSVLGERAEIIREKGTNRAKFLSGKVDKYTWVDIGSSYLPSELNAAYLLEQLEKIDEINDSRLAAWSRYYRNLGGLQESGYVTLPFIPDYTRHNAHMFYIIVRDKDQRTSLMDYLAKRGIITVSHYVPLHSSPAGKRFGTFHGEDIHTTKQSNKLLRLPLFYGISESSVDRVCEEISTFFINRK